MSSCARTDCASPSTLCVTMTATAAMAPMSLWSVVSELSLLMRQLKQKQLVLSSSLCHRCSFLRCRISHVWTQWVPLCQWTLPHQEFMGVWWRLWLPWPIRWSPQEPTLHWARLEPERHGRSNYFSSNYLLKRGRRKCCFSLYEIAGSFGMMQGRIS